MHRLLLRYTFWFIILDYTVKNAKLGIKFQKQKIWINFRIHFSQTYNDVRNSKIAAGQYGFNRSNVFMKQETTKALNELTKDVSYYCETI